MSSSSQSQPEGAKAQRPQLSRVLEAERDKPSTVVKDHETQIERLQQSFKRRHQSIILDAEKAFKASAEARCDLERKLQEEKQRVNELAGKLDETKHKETTVKLASEKVNHGLTRIALNKSKSELDEAKSEVAVLKEALGAFERKASELYDTIDDVHRYKNQVQAELDLSRSESAELQQRIQAAEQRNVDLETDLKAATKRAEGAEGELQAFKSRFQQINDLMTTLASPSDKQSTSPAPTSNDQGSVEQRESGPQKSNAPVPPQSLGLQANNTASDNESDMLHCKSTLDEVMDTTKNWYSNQYFLRAMDSLTLASRDAKVGPMNLGTMKEKLAKGAYNSVTSFKADFDLMITDARTMNPPRNCVRIAAEQLSKIFDQAFSSRSVPGHEPRETARSAQDTNGKKRKAGTDALSTPTDEPVRKRLSLTPNKQKTDSVQPAIPDTRISTTRSSTASVPSAGATKSPEHIDAEHVKGQITVSGRLDIDATFSAVAKLVSLEKSPSTITGHWKSLVPSDYWLTAHALPIKVEERINYVEHLPHLDMIILRLLPATGVDKPEFNRLLEYFIQRQRFATVSHFGINNVEDIYLVPSSKMAEYPKFLAGLDHGRLPAAKVEDVLFMAIVFSVTVQKQSHVRAAWGQRMKAIQNHDNGGLVTMRNDLARKSLQIFRREGFVLTSAERYQSKIRSMPCFEGTMSPELRVHGQDILRLSYTRWIRDKGSHRVTAKASRPSIDTVMAPQWVFVLGCVISSANNLGVLVVDIQHRDRPLWLIRFAEITKREYWSSCIILVGSKFPSTLREWERNLPTLVPTRNGPASIKNVGLKIERAKFP